MVTISGCRAAGSLHFLILDFQARSTSTIMLEEGEKATTCSGGCASVIKPLCNAAMPNAAVNIAEQRVGLEADYSPDDSTASLPNESQCGAAQLEPLKTPIVLPKKQHEADVLLLVKENFALRPKNTDTGIQVP